MVSNNQIGSNELCASLSSFKLDFLKKRQPKLTPVPSNFILVNTTYLCFNGYIVLYSYI